MSEPGRKGRDLLGMPVYTVQEGKRLGEITGLYVSREDSTVAAVGLGNGGRNVVLPYGSLRLVGEDIVLLEGEPVLEQALDSNAIRELDSGLSGRPVLTRSGQRLGTILGIRVETVHGRIETYRVRPESGLIAQLAAAVLDRGQEIPVHQVISLGNDALIVSDEAAASGEPASAEDAPAPGCQA